MQKHTFYRVINFIVLPLALLIGLQAFVVLMVAFTNPTLLLVAFMLACIPIYAFTANYFYNKSVMKGEQSKASLKEWIKANAVVSIIFSVFMLLACLGMLAALNNPKFAEDIRSQLETGSQTQVSAEELAKMMKLYCYIFIPFSLLLLTHIIITFRLLKQHNHMFGYSSNDPK